MLLEIFQAQAAQGAFAEVGTIGSVESTFDDSASTGAGSDSDRSSARDTSDGDSEDPAEVGIPVGAVAGVLLVSAVVGGYMYNKRKLATESEAGATTGKYDDTDDSSYDEGGARDAPIVIEAVATLVEDDYLKKMNGKK